MSKYKRSYDLKKSRAGQDGQFKDGIIKISETNFANSTQGSNSFDQQLPTVDKTRSNSSNDRTCTATPVVDTNDNEDCTLNDCCCSDLKSQNDIYDVFIYSPQTTLVSTEIITALRTKHNFLCCDSRSFIPGETRLDNFGNCLDSSKQLILVISPEFLKCEISMYFTHMAVVYRMTNKQKTYRILVILDGVKTNNLPNTIKPLTCFSTKQKDWFRSLLRFVRGEDYGNVPQLHVTTTDTAMSDPLPLRDIPASVKKNSQMLLMRLKLESPMTEEQEQLLLKPIECDNVDYKSNMKYFHRLKADDKPVYEIIETFKSQKVRVHSGDIVEVLNFTKCKKRVIIQNAKRRTMAIRASLLSPVLSEMPSIVTNKLASPITESQNAHFMEELKYLGCRIVRAKDTILTHDNQLKINPGDILRLLEKMEGDKWIRIMNFRCQTGIVDKSTCETVVI
ncbi:uncharacterized protein LOC126819364 [Patella vulgata]|uniref:uncharacterized protein LOC126819364 n=1 Tax=Patella vulgata TaxID=6465 RepID=UPI00217F5DF5|nr:uncharacterized protein LOC126819364 [Patella vulgata]